MKKVFVLIGYILLQACATPVDIDYKPSIDFAGFKGYQWQPVPQAHYNDPRLNSSLLHERIQSAMNATLQRKGFILLQSGKPDFYIAYHLRLEKRTEADTVGFGLGFHHRHYGWGLGTETILREYDESTLIIDVLDPESGDILWRGSLGNRVTRADSVAEKDSNIQHQVNTILSEFPPL